jgi:ribosomal protein S18 acetylase RimI-like enzyme
MVECSKLNVRQVSQLGGADRTADARLISVLGTVAFYEAYYRQDEPESLVGYILDSFSPELILAEIEDLAATFFIIYNDEKAVGFAKLLRGEPHASVVGEDPIELQRIYVIADVYGMGVGEHLLNHCLDFARGGGFKTLWLGVWQENLRGQRFYQKHGFRKVGTKPFPYGDDFESNHIMQIGLG